jgi:hypothetical protein
VTAVFFFDAMIAPFWLETLRIHCRTSPYSSLFWPLAPKIPTRTLISRPPPPSPRVSFDAFFTVLLDVLFDVFLNVSFAVFLPVLFAVSFDVFFAVFFIVSCNVFLDVFLDVLFAVRFVIFRGILTADRSFLLFAPPLH